MTYGDGFVTGALLAFVVLYAIAATMVSEDRKEQLTDCRAKLAAVEQKEGGK